MASPSPQVLAKVAEDTKAIKESADTNATQSGSATQTQTVAELHLQQNTMALRLQQYERARRAYQDVVVGHGFQIRVVSKENAKRVFTQLKLGSEYLAQCISSESTEKKLSAEELKLYQDKKLTATERDLFEFIHRNINFRHATSARAEMEDSMSPLKVRQFEGAGTENRHTSVVTRDDGNLFFTAGIGKHPTPGFLGKKVDTIVINPSALQDKFITAYAWMSGHIHEYQDSRYSRPVILGDTKFVMKHDEKTLRKTFRYVRSNGIIFERVVNFRDEVFSGRHLLPAIPLQFIQHLRFVGGTFRQNIFDTLASQQISNEAKLQIISAAMTELMPGWITLEVKIPAKIQLNQIGISTEYNKQATEKEEAAKKQLQATEWLARMNTLMGDTRAAYKKGQNETLGQILANVQQHPDHKVADLLKEAVLSGEIAKVQPFIDFKVPLNLYPCNENETNLLVEVFEIDNLAKRHAMLKFLLNQGIRFTHLHNFSNPLHKAIQKRDHVAMDILLKVRETHPDNPLISYSIHLNNISGLMLFDKSSDYLAVACNNGDKKAFEMLVSAGADPHLLQEILILASISNKHYAMVRYLKQKFGISLAGEYRSIRSPLIACARNNDLEGMQVCLELAADPNCSTWLDDTLSNKDTKESKISAAGFRPLHFAVANASVPAIDILGKAKADTEVETECFETPLMLARRLKVGKHIEDALIKWGARDTLTANAKSGTTLATVAVSDTKERDEVCQKEYLNMNDIHLCLEHDYRVVAIVTAYNSRKERVVLMGRYWQAGSQTQSDPIQTRYDFPMGIRNNRETSAQAAIRQLKIDTGLDLNPAFSEGRLKANELPPFVYGYGPKLIKIAHIHFEIGEIEKFRYKAGANFAVIDWLPLEAIQRNPKLNYTNCYSVNVRGKQFKLKGSYGMMVELLGVNAATRRPELTRLLPKIYAIENFGLQLLTMATLDNNKPWMEDLMQHGVSPHNVQTKDGRSLFGLSVQHATPQTIRYVGTFFFDEKTRKPKHPLGTHPLLLAICSDREDRKEILELLFTNYNFREEDPEEYVGKTALYAAVSVGDKISTGRILKEFINISDLNEIFGEQYFITKAAESGSLEIVQQLIAAGASVNPSPVGMAQGYIVRLPLHAAIKAGKYDVAKFLLDAGADVNASNGLKKEDIFAYNMRAGDRIGTANNPFDMIEMVAESAREQSSILPMGAYAVAYFYGQAEIADDILAQPKLDLKKALSEVLQIESKMTMQFMMNSSFDSKKSKLILTKLKNKIADQENSKNQLDAKILADDNRVKTGYNAVNALLSTTGARAAAQPKNLSVAVAGNGTALVPAAATAFHSKVNSEKYSVFFSTAHQNAVDEQSGTGDVDYTEALKEEINANAKALAAADFAKIALFEPAHYIRKLFTEEEIYQYIDRHKATQIPLLHIMINAPRTGFAFTTKGLEGFKQAGGKLVVTAVEFFKHSDRPEASKLIVDTLNYLRVADGIIFLDEFDKDFALEAAGKYLTHDKMLAGKLAAAKVIPVPPTIELPAQNQQCVVRGTNIITFGMIRAGKGLAHVDKLARLMKKNTDPVVKSKKVLVVGTVQEHDPGAMKQLTKLMTSLYSAKKPKILGCKNSAELKVLLAKCKAEEAAGKLAADLPMELHVDVPKADLAALFNLCTYAYLPMYRGATLRNSSISNAIAQSFVTYSHQDTITPRVLLKGKYQNAMVIMKDDKYEHYADKVLKDIEQREANKKLNENTIHTAKMLVEDVLSRAVVAKQHIDVYVSLGVDLQHTKGPQLGVGTATSHRFKL